MPRALGALLAATALLGVSWAIVQPPFQSPDESAHVAYVQTLAELGQLPGAAGRPAASTEQVRASDAANAEQTAQVLATKPEWSKDAYELWLERSERLPESARENGGGPHFANANPPLYYALETLPYRTASGGDLFARITAMRLGSVLFLLVTVAATWLLAGTVFGPRRDLQLAAASIPALMPMVTFISSSVNPDALLFALWTLALWLGARILVRQGGPVDVAALLAVTGLALATKSVSFALVPAVLLVLGVALWRLRARRRLVAVLAACAVVGFAATAGAWYVVARNSDRPVAAQLSDAVGGSSDVDARGFLSYAWQYYLPRLPFQSAYPGLDFDPPNGYEVWVRQTWGTFGWLETRWPKEAYAPLSAFTLLVLAGALVALVRRRRTLDLPLLAFFALAALALLFGLHWNEYKLFQETGGLINQGRYIFPLIGLAGLAFAAALTLIPERLRGTVLAVVLAGLAVLQLFSIGLVAERFYA